MTIQLRLSRTKLLYDNRNAGFRKTAYLMQRKASVSLMERLPFSRAYSLFSSSFSIFFITAAFNQHRCLSCLMGTAHMLDIFIPRCLFQ